jgi:hypothetical protein
MAETRNVYKHFWLENPMGRNHLGDRDILTKRVSIYILALNKANGRILKTVINLWVP